MLERRLKNLGLSDKEIRVYLAALELGPDTIQRISQKAGINRPTAYLMIDSLTEKGLVSSFLKGKKKFFVAEPPERLLSLLRIQEKELQEKEKELENILPELKAIHNVAGEKPKVRFFEGIEGLKAMQDDYFHTKSKELKEIVPLDLAYELFPPHGEDHRKKASEEFKDIPIKVLYSSKKGAILSEREGLKIRKYVSPEKFPFSSEILIYGANKIAIFTLTQRPIGVIIESIEMHNSLSALFDLAWQAPNDL